MASDGPLKLTHDLITDILSRVSDKDLMRFTCVSKSWCNFIYIDSYLSHLRSQRTALLGRPFLLVEIGKTSCSGARLFYHHRLDLDSIDDGNPKPREIHNPFDHDRCCPRPDAFVIGSCEGLLVFKQSSSHKMIVSNPTTKKHHVVPPNPAGDDNVVFRGFGYDHVHGCYKLVTKIKPASNQGVELMIYNVNNRTWKKSRFDGLGNDVPSYKNFWGKCVDGALYWCVCGSNILCFLLAEEEFHEVDPPDFDGVMYHFSLTVFDGRLCLVCESPRMERVEFWLMECDYKRQSESSYSWHWTKFLSILDVKAMLQPHSRIDLIPICFSVCGKKILFNVNHLQLFWYDLERNKFQELKNCIGRFGYVLVTSCVPSLVEIGIS